MRDFFLGDLSKLRPVYLLTGEEETLIDGVRRSILEVTKEKGLEKETLWIEKSTGAALIEEAALPFLFSSKKAIDARFFETPSAAEGKALERLASRPPALLLVSLPKLSFQERKTSWFSRFCKDKAVVEITPPRGKAFCAWLGFEARHLGVGLENESLLAMARLLEGDFAGARAALERLRLLFGEKRLLPEEALSVVEAGSAPLSLALQMLFADKDKARFFHALFALRAGGTPVELVIAAIVREGKRRGVADLAFYAGGARADAAAKGLLLANAWDEIAWMAKGFFDNHG